MNTRETLLQRVRTATEALPNRTPLPPAEAVAALGSRLIPTAEMQEAVVEAFCARWREASGVLLRSVAELEAFLQAEGAAVGYADPAALALLGVESLPGAATVYERAQVDTLQFGVTVAFGGIAESGTVMLTDRGTSNRLAALAPWVHIAIVRKDRIHRSLTDAIASFDDDPSIVFVTGPSKTADIEGILIEGVHGPGRQAALLV